MTTDAISLENLFLYRHTQDLMHFYLNLLRKRLYYPERLNDSSLLFSSFLQ